MAITEERLEELIEKGVEIYSIYESLFDKPCVSYIEFDRDWFFEIENGNLEIRGYDIVGDEFLTDHSLDKLFETKAEAEFCAKYKNIQRTETLDLPTYKEVETYNKEIPCWLDFYNNGEQFICNNKDINDTKYLRIYSREKIYFSKPLTYENYIEACEVCKKLFLGEVVDNENNNT